MKSAFTIIAC